MSISTINQARGKTTPASSGGSFRAENRSDPEGHLPTGPGAALLEDAELASFVAGVLNGDTGDTKSFALYQAAKVFGVSRNDADTWVFEVGDVRLGALQEQIAGTLNDDGQEGELGALVAVASALGLARGGDGRWSAAASAATAPAVLPVSPDWANGGTQNAMLIVESPVSDRERNYYLTFLNNIDSFVTVNPAEFGILDPELDAAPGQDNARMHFETSGYDDNIVHVQYVEQSDELRELRDRISGVDDIPQATADAIEVDIREELQRIYGDKVGVEFSSGGERWDDISVTYDMEYEAGRNAAGQLEATTSNIMFEVERNPNYQSITAGYADQAIFNVFRKHDIDVE